MGKRTWLVLVGLASQFFCSPAWAQLNQNCIITVLNRTVNANPDGTWVLPNIPANLGQVKARATCTQNGVTTFGESDFFTVPANGAVNLPTIVMGNTTPIPVSLLISTSTPSLTNAGQTTQLSVSATYPDGSTKDVSASTTGTNYTISNNAIATITPDGLITAVSSGTVVIQANNDGATGIITAQVAIGGATNGGIPVSWALANNLNPNDPTMPYQDPDRDGLTNLQEYQLGTDPHNPDTDGDGLSDGDEVNIYHTNPLLADTDGDKIPDGVEVGTGTNPLDPKSYDLKKATATSTVTPPTFSLTTGIGNPITSVHLDWKVVLIDGKTTLDLTNDPRTSFSSSSLSICGLDQQPGLVLSVGTGSCIITISQNTLTATVSGSVVSFSPSEIATLVVPGAVAVDVGGAFAYVAAGTNGMVVVDVNNRAKPFTRGTLTKFGDAEGIRASGQYVFIADATGFIRVANIQNPDAPSLVTSLALSGSPLALAVHGNMLACAAQAGGIALFDITIPANPSLLSTIATSSPAVGVDFDTSSGLMAIALGTGGLQIADISSPTKPRLRGSLAGGNVKRVLIRLPAVLLADSSRSITSVDITNPDKPTLSISLASNLGGVPVDIAAFGNIAMSADITFGRAVPIVNISSPLQPVSVGFWTLLSPGYSSSIAVDLAFGYLVVPAINTLRILQYQQIVDPFGIPPQVALTAPAAGESLIQGQTVTVSANATDDVAVALVNFLVNGQTVFNTAAQPYQFQYVVPSSATTLTIGATAVDYGNNVGVAQNVQVSVIPDPGTTVTGTVVDATGSPVNGATISIPSFQSSPNTKTSSNGTFSLSGVSTIAGNIEILATFVNASGATLAGFSSAAPPVRGGTTTAGTITIIPIPIITTMSAKSMLENSQLSLNIVGTTLQGASWSFSPASATPIAIKVVSTSQDGTSASLSVTAPAGVTGTYVLVATNAAGNSGTTSNRVNRLTIVDPNSTTDTDGDGFQDVIEAVFGTDPLDPTSFPTIPRAPEAESVGFSVLNAPVSGNATEAESVGFSVLNAPVSGNATEAESVGFSVLNAPIGTAGITEADAYFTLCNGSNCAAAKTSTTANAKSATSQSTTSTQDATAAAIDPLADTDSDGLPDWFELLVGTDPNKQDTDGDGLTDFQELFVHHTNPLDTDTDADGFTDGEEVIFGSDPLNSASTPLIVWNRGLARNNKTNKTLQTSKGGTNGKENTGKLKPGKASLGTGIGSLSLRGSDH